MCAGCTPGSSPCLPSSSLFSLSACLLPPPPISLPLDYSSLDLIACILACRVWQVLSLGNIGEVYCCNNHNGNPSFLCIFWVTQSHTIVMMQALPLLPLYGGLNEKCPSEAQLVPSWWHCVRRHCSLAEGIISPGVGFESPQAHPTSNFFFLHFVRGWRHDLLVY